MQTSEILSADEVADLTGYAHIARQREWLDRQGWTYLCSQSGRPIVGRWYARMMLAGIAPTASSVSRQGLPNFAALD